LADYQATLGEFQRRGVTVTAGSIDGLDDAKKTTETLALTYPLAYGLNAREVAAATGAFMEEKRGILHATSFVVAPDGGVANASYSTGPIGRLTPQDCIGLIDFRMKA
jgi:peroxiredoxin